MVVNKAGIGSTIAYTLGPHNEGKPAATAFESVAGMKVCVYGTPLYGAIEKSFNIVGRVRTVTKHGFWRTTVNGLVAAGLDG